ncbi:hypothetical protein ACTGVR_00695 [Streptococcus suis]|uniref:hypothetical protein n=1 Tax=Streptococcus suis TaxID=1307 RepID=UPI0011461336|nr:hypothetical protein [Streptococcus suis]NQO92041.1 hypothetical protein [Streptococcus suis]NQQ49986.1 hypothetical protein [Streptococcus suis]TQE78913.1 hypothetical protein FH688_07655 [Streptococcus suis]
MVAIEDFLEQNNDLKLSKGATSRAGKIIGDDYPASWKKRPDEFDTWGYNKSTCTSFVAHRLHSVNKFEVPRAMGDAGQ